jgi:seryl-tRNA synthetase
LWKLYSKYRDGREGFDNLIMNFLKVSQTIYELQQKQNKNIDNIVEQLNKLKSDLNLLKPIINKNDKTSDNLLESSKNLKDLSGIMKNSSVDYKVLSTNIELIKKLINNLILTMKNSKK